MHHSGSENFALADFADPHELAPVRFARKIVERQLQ